MPESSLFFGDIDPNQVGQAITATQMRRQLLYRLLIWDNIVVSDSQMLQDPRFRVMMEPTVVQDLLMRVQDLPMRVQNLMTRNQLNEDKQFDDLEGWQRGFELLLKSGLIKVARRDGSKLTETWSEMNERENGVPFLPRSESYSKYIEEVGYTASDYKLSSVADRFSQNLRNGIDTKAIPLDNSNSAHLALQELMCQDGVLLADILALLKKQLDAGTITLEEKDRFYQFSFQCYSVNVPAALGCNISAKLRQIPLFLPSGTYDGVYEAALLNQNRMRSSWAIDPEALDLLPIEAFINLRKKLKDDLKENFSLLLKQQEGNLQPEEVKEFYEVWETFIETLQEEMKSGLRAERDKLNEITTKGYKSAQDQLENTFTEFVTNEVVSAIPGVGTVKSAVDAYKKVKEVKDTLIVFNQKKAQPYFVEHHDKIQRYLDSLYDRDVSIITKY